jgi:hypothetical protein
MSATSGNKTVFRTFHSSTRCLPQELVNRIVELATCDSSPLGARNSRYPALVATCHSFREAFLDQHIGVPCPPYDSSSHHVAQCLPRWIDRTKQGLPKDHRPRMGESLHFPDLTSLIDFFENGPGRLHAGHDRNCTRCDQMPLLNTVRKTKSISVCYIDSQEAFRCNRTYDSAYEAFETLVYNLHQMQIERLRIRFHGCLEVHDVDAPGIWSLLKIRNLPTLILDGRRGSVDPQIRTILQGRTRWASDCPWTPLGSENPGPNDWRERVRPRSRIEINRAQYTWLDRRYRFRQHIGFRRARNLAARAARLRRLAASGKPPRRGESAEMDGFSISKLRERAAQSAQEEAKRAKDLTKTDARTWAQRQLLLKKFTLNQIRGASTAHSSRMLSLKIGKGEVLRTVPKAMLRKSPYFKDAVDGPFQEVQRRIIKLPEESVEAVDIALRYLATGTYNLPLTVLEDDHDTITEDHRDIIKLHAIVAELADKWFLHELKQLALSHVKHIWASNSSNAVYESTRLIYSQFQAREGHGIPKGLRMTFIEYYRRLRIESDLQLPTPIGATELDEDVAATMQ